MTDHFSLLVRPHLRFSRRRLALAITLSLLGQARADKVRIIESPREASQIRVDLIQQAKRPLR